MKEIRTEITINSNPEKVWGVLTNFEKHPEWNSFIISIIGNKKAGEQIIIKIQPPGGGAMTFKPVVLIYNQNKEFRWKGKLLLNGFLDGEHYFEIIDHNNGTVTFVHGEIFTGLLVSIFSNILDKTKDGFEMMNKALKEECEK